MTQHAEFLIEGRSFNVDAGAQQSEQFEVKSVPRPYHVSWDESENPLTKINELFQLNDKNILLIDEKLLELYRADIKFSTEQIIAVPATETFKTLDGVNKVFDFLYQKGFTKGERLIVVGGGIVQDVGAFTAACYKRGIQWLYFPTTLLSMCDSCIGAKAGVNFKEAKNQIGLFSAPSQVIINPNFLQTLAQNDINSGLGEILKLSITAGEPFLSTYQSVVMNGVVKNKSDYKTLILMGLQIKRAIIEVDEFDMSYRKSLNYGHTLGHAIEVMSDYVIAHGVAVTIGMMLSNEISQQRGLLDEVTKQQLNKLCHDLLDEKTLAVMANIKVDALLQLLKNDKKTEGDHINYVVMKRPGDAQFIKLKLDDELRTKIGNIVKQTFN